MNYYPDSLINLIKQLAKLPGIGEKTAERLALHILRGSERDAQLLSHSINELKKKVRFCARCFALSDNEFCRICSDPARDATLLCVVEQPADMVAIEKSGAFDGFYHILGGVLSSMDGVGPDSIRVAELIQNIRAGKINEVIIATSTNLEGESTASYLGRLLSEFPVKVSRIASGVPMGGDLKYVDQVTLKRALETRHDF